MIKVVVISFTFPPQIGIGGRRWAKFVKYFSRQGLDVQVFSTPISIEGSPWVKDIPEKLQVSRFETKYPDVIRFGPSTIWGKFKYRIELLGLKLNTEGNYFDHSIFWDKQFLPKLEQELDDVDVLIASSGPFSYLHSLLSLKLKYPNLKLVVDFRDPWTNNKTAYGFDQLAPRRLTFEKKMEKEVIEGFDLIVSVAQPMTDHFKLISRGNVQEKFVTLWNGYDPDDRVELNAQSVGSEKVKICFVGTLYGKTYDSVNTLVTVLKKYQNVIEVTFCGDMNRDSQKELSTAENVKLLGSVSGEKAKQIIASSDIGLLILTNDLTYSFSTKFCEYVQMRKPIWIISEDGSTPAFILDNNIGYHSLPNTRSISDTIQNFLSNEINGLYDQFDDSKFNLEEISNEYISHIEALTNDE